MMACWDGITHPQHGYTGTVPFPRLSGRSSGHEWTARMACSFCACVQELLRNSAGAVVG